jgi:hypothetical protein
MQYLVWVSWDSCLNSTMSPLFTDDETAVAEVFSVCSACSSPWKRKWEKYSVGQSEQSCVRSVFVPCDQLNWTGTVTM